MVGGIPAPHSEWGCKPKPQKIPPPLGGSDGLLLRTVRCSISRRTATHEVVPPWWRIGGLVTCGRNARSRLLPGRYNGRLPGAPDLSAFRWVAPRGSVRGSLCWPLGSSGRSLRALSLPTPCSEAAETRARRVGRRRGGGCPLLFRRPLPAPDVHLSAYPAFQCLIAARAAEPASGLALGISPTLLALDRRHLPPFPV